MVVKDEQSALIICTANRPDICRMVMTFAAPLAPPRGSEAAACPLLGGWEICYLREERKGACLLPQTHCRLCACSRPEQGEAMLNFE